MLDFRHNIFIIALLLLLALSSCGNGASVPAPSMGGDTITERSKLLTLVRYDSLYTVATIANPWDPGNTLARYILIDRNKPRPENLPEGTVVEVPVERSVVYSIVYQEAIGEMGAIDAICGVADESYITSPELCNRIRDGRVVGIGSSHNPRVDLITGSRADAILVSPYGTNTHPEIDTLGIPVIECADYMEPTPLARAEWVLLIGELFGCPDKALEVYKGVVDEYTSIADMVQQNIVVSNKVRPRVLTEMVHGGEWYVPGGKSYMARLFADAGADYPWADNDDSGSICLDAPTVLNKAQGADFWLVRTVGKDISSDSLKENCPLNSRFKAFVDGNVYGCNTSESNIYNDIAFHPERILRDYVIIFHPELLPEQSPRYYKRMDK